MQLLKKKNQPCKLLLKDEGIKFSADRFLVNKWLFAKTNEHFRLVQARSKFFRHYKITFYENFKALRLNLNEQIASEERPFLVIFIFFFYLNNRPILMLHVSFCRYFEYLHFSYQIFFHVINIFHFINEKHAFLHLFDFISHISVTSLKSQT